MALKIIGSEARVHWLTDTHDNGRLTSDHGIIYVTRGGLDKNGKFKSGKLGKADAESYAGLKPGEVFERRYGSDKAPLDGNFYADDIFVFDKNSTTDADKDDGIRKLIYDLKRKGRINFSANVNSLQVEDTNSEALLDYIPEIHLPQLIAILKQYFGIEQHYDTKDPVVWRWQQKEEVEEIVDTLTNHRLCLYAAYTGRGKTKISMEVATRLLSGGGLVLVTTPITDTKKSFQDNINDFHFGSNRGLQTTYIDAAEFSKHTVKSLRSRANGGELIFVVLTVQDLRWGDQNTTGIRKKYDQLNGNVDLWIRDERHSQYNGEVTSERLSEITARYELDLTATPYNVLDQYHLDHIVSRTLLWGLTNKQHTGLPSIAVDVISAPVSALSPALSDIYSVEEGYDPRKLFVRENGNFVLTREIEILADRFYHQSLSKKKNPLTIVNDTILSDTAKLCGMWVLPQGQDGDSAGDYIPALATLLNTRFAGGGVHYIDSYTVERQCPVDRSVGQYIEDLLSQHTRVIILTCGKFLTGTDIPCLGHVVLFDRMASIANFEQLLGRMTRGYPVKNPTKDRVKLYSLVPGHEIRVVLGRMATANATLGEAQDWEILDCVPLSEYDLSGQVKPVTPEEILESAQLWYREQLHSRLPSASLRSAISGIDTELWSSVNTRKFKKHAPKTGLSDENGARVRNRLSDKRDSGSNKNRSDVEAIADTIQTVMAEAQWVAFSINNYDYRVVLRQEPIVQMFGVETIDAIFDATYQSSEIEKLIRTYLLDRQLAYSNLPPEEVYSEIFVNNELKMSIGLVYLDFELANKLLDTL